MIHSPMGELDPVIPTATERLQQPEVFAFPPPPTKEKPNSSLQVNLRSAGRALCLSGRPAHCRAQFLPLEGRCPAETDRHRMEDRGKLCPGR